MDLKKDRIIRLALAVIGIFFIGTGVAFNAAAALGNDPIGIMYDGIRNAADLSPEQLGFASNIVNISLAVIVLLQNRHYISIGTLIYIIPYGAIVDMGRKVYYALFKMQTLSVQVIGAALGCMLLYLGVAMYIVADIGLDPFTGIVMVLRDKCKKEYKLVKICFDVVCVFIGFVLGGKLGVITIITAVTAGPMIQIFTDYIRVRLKRLLDRNSNKYKK